MDLGVALVQEWKTYWSAALVVDGYITTFSCNHNHKTKPAALKCADNVLTQARRFVWHPEFQERVVDTSDWDQDDPRPLIEWSRTSGTTRFRKSLDKLA